MSAVISASVKAGPLFPATTGPFIMGGSLYIHELTPELARQWIQALTEKAEETE